MNLNLKTEALRLKTILNKINDTSWAYDQINKSMPFNSIKTDIELQDLINAYRAIINDLFSYIKTTNYGNQNNQD